MSWGPLSGVCAFTEGAGLIGSAVTYIANILVTDGADAIVTDTGDTIITKEEA